jgi:Putative prokaryotic signal transducing protein
MPRGRTPAPRFSIRIIDGSCADRNPGGVRSSRYAPLQILAESEDLEFQSLVTIQQFRDSADAWLAKSALESAGIFAFLRDENTVRVHWGWSNAVGGIRLQVRPEDEAAAEEVLSQPIQSAIESEGVEYEQPRCPYCQSLDIDFESLNPKVGLASIIVAVPIPWPQKLWTCNTCGKKWNDQLGADG